MYPFVELLLCSNHVYKITKTWSAKLSGMSQSTNKMAIIEIGEFVILSSIFDILIVYTRATLNAAKPSATLDQ